MLLGFDKQIFTKPDLIAGSYLGDVFSFDFERMAYIEHKLSGGVDDGLLSRSNHSVIYYESHNS